MASENETFDEVLRCMQNDIVHFVGKSVKHSRDLLQEYHDRFKAAHRREVDVVLKDRDEMFKSEQDTVAKTKEWFDEYQKLKLEVAELKSKMNDVVCENEALRDACETCGAKREREATREKSSRVGNAAKMREALRQVSRVAVEMTRKTVTGESEDRKTVDEWALRLCDIVSATLATPPRNCDVGTDEEQSRRYEELCDSHTCGSRCSATGCPMYEHDCSPFAWGQMPYEEGGAK